MLETELTPNEAAAAPQAAITRARAAFAKYGGLCCWYWRDDVPLVTIKEIRRLTDCLRKNGNRETWFVAREIERCL